MPTTERVSEERLSEMLAGLKGRAGTFGQFDKYVMYPPDTMRSILTELQSLRSRSSGVQEDGRLLSALATYGKWAIDVATLGQLADLESRMEQVGVTLQDLGPLSALEPAEPVEGEAWWSYSINYGPDGQEDWANLTTPTGEHVANIRTHHARAIVSGLNDALLNSSPLRKALQAIADATNPDDPESYRSDDREGCLDAVHAIATAALTKEGA